jgi:hypothetical protein
VTTTFQSAAMAFASVKVQRPGHVGA